MKRDFLKNFKVGDQMLPDEIVDAIMAENGRDIEAAKKPFADYALMGGRDMAMETLHRSSCLNFILLDLCKNIRKTVYRNSAA